MGPSYTSLNLDQRGDEGVKEKWGENIYIINLSSKGEVKAGKMDFNIRQQ
ncbi:hypothetical protein [Cyclobacterium qasimii]|uniref:Heparinase II/III family protein n=2 Tax=Cyclobacterium qasimii TaxID=1350429 RepID=S7VGW6_9BACT|nr:hypothetical protein [Cyclobacterium qasimii]EPR69221.1 Heparinase II/III family protein [Cyclobacterium qasimii M12-11B]GEO20986.1 hypothetical protein CQA01_15200 [Cyclobacterium qasimii]